MSTISLSDLEDRFAQCVYCKQVEPSAPGLPFFEYQGPGNGRECDVCRVVARVHDGIGLEGEPLPPTSVPAQRLAAHPAHDFTDAIGREYDTFYCGCRGWD